MTTNNFDEFKDSSNTYKVNDVELSKDTIHDRNVVYLRNEAHDVIYHSLCDDIGIKPVLGCTAYDILSEDEADAFCDDYCGRCKYHGDIYPPQSAEQILRLEELILNLGRLSYHKSDIYYICILSRVNNANNGMAGTRPEALYTLTHKLIKEGVFSKEEVKEALSGR